MRQDLEQGENAYVVIDDILIYRKRRKLLEKSYKSETGLGRGLGFLLDLFQESKRTMRLASRLDPWWNKSLVQMEWTEGHLVRSCLLSHLFLSTAITGICKTFLWPIFVFFYPQIWRMWRWNWTSAIVLLCECVFYKWHTRKSKWKLLLPLGPFYYFLYVNVFKYKLPFWKTCEILNEGDKGKISPNL